MSRENYEAFVEALLAAEKTEFREFEGTPYFDGCLPIEVMAERGRETLRHGPMKPFGLTNAHEPKVKPYAVVQLRQDNALGSLFNIVGFQTKLKYGEQARIFRMIPGLEQAEFARLGGIHRNTYLNSPKLLDATLRLKAEPRLRFAGQITGCEGYVESAAIGLIAGRLAAGDRLGSALDAAAGHHRDRRAPQPPHRRPHRIDRRRPPLVPADERQFRPLSPDRRAARRCGGRAPSRARARRGAQARALGAGRGRPSRLDGERPRCKARKRGRIGARPEVRGSEGKAPASASRESWTHRGLPLSRLGLVVRRPDGMQDDARVGRLGERLGDRVTAVRDERIGATKLLDERDGLGRLLLARMASSSVNWSRWVASSSSSRWAIRIIAASKRPPVETTSDRSGKG